jgi:2-polyprenyl-3-methyl-5-hydroxy-6-metoxy-1,4-benzoquinol methylase
MPVKYPGTAPVLDVGCGNGQRLLELQTKGCTNLFGVEPTSESAEQARLHTSADIRCSLLSGAELPEAHFQLVIMNQVLEHVPSPTETLRLIRRMLRPGGVLYLTVPNFSSIESRIFGAHWSGLQVPAHLHHFTAVALRRLLDQSGYEVLTWRTDTVVSVTRLSLTDWCGAAPSLAKKLASKTPSALLLLVTMMLDACGRGQMLRVVARSR